MDSLRTKCIDGISVNEGDILYFNTWGGGGWGDPYARDPELVRQDIERRLVTVEGARRYGVVIAGGLLREGSSSPLQFGEPTDVAFLYSNSLSIIGNSVGAGEAFRLGSPRILHQAVELGVEGRGFFAGGYRDLQLTPSKRFDIFDIAGYPAVKGRTLVENLLASAQPAS